MRTNALNIEPLAASLVTATSNLSRPCSKPSPLAPSYGSPAPSRDRPLTPVYNMRMDDLPALQPQTPALALPSNVDLLSGLPRWQREYLSARAAGATDKEAAVSSRSSVETIQEWLTKSRARVDGGKFWYAYSAIVEGVYIAGGPAAVRARHIEDADAILDHLTNVALNRAPDGPVRHRDQIGAGDKVLAAVQLTGQGAQASARVDVTIRIATTGARPPLTTINAAVEHADPPTPADDDK